MKSEWVMQEKTFKILITKKKKKKNMQEIKTATH